MKPIVLVGYMCAGKTTVGKQLAKETGKVFYDLDWYIETRFRKKVSQIFAEEGEEGFRRKERAMLHEVAEFENIVLSCGGGTPCFFDNMDYLNERAEVFYMKAPVETLLRHLKMSRGDRPLIKGKSEEELRIFVTEQLEAREPFYSKARHIIDIGILDEEEKINKVVETIKISAHEKMEN